ncbi:hypothetical protein SRB5_69880 [Streptomyces sp. RB5]|uniref:Integral membrane protein n=1 Tax=Streptomyces smaragdinus TaxID=2585196 RepID=A0A7K0CTH6_9ACTN|nr:DUF6350 family protein [Streptomyces smaragdinus]MQY16785.1 hypothetical protein [Streptomyces smaragdinus]
MSQLTEHGPWLSADLRAAGRRRPVTPLQALAAGATAAGLGLGFLAVLVLLLWITSPYPDRGPGGALQVVADLWLLAHGADLVRTDAAAGAWAPVGLTPLLLSAMPVYLIVRSTRDLLAPGGAEPREGTAPLTTAGWVACGYLLPAAAATGYAAYGGGTLRASVPATLLQLPLTVLLCVAAAVWAAAGTPAALLPRREAQAQPLAPWAEGALKAAATGVAVLLGGGLLLTLGALAVHAGAAQESFVQLTSAVSGRFSVLLLAVALLPNAAIWAAAYGLGPGFTVGVGSAVAPLGAAGYPQLPSFPLLAALPAEGPGSPLTWCVALVPVAAALAVARVTARAAVPVRGSRELCWSWPVTLGTAALAAVGTGVALTALAWLAGGPMGRHTLAEFGPVWWRTGGAALAWTLALGVPAALTGRRLRLRDAEPVPGAWTWAVQDRWALWEPRSAIAADIDDEDGDAEKEDDTAAAKD